ncbi:MAG: hypothetical protein M3473_03265 [Chloroflexota bacterium]|nr:hypothetical protein [Chloroflexota bacterium]
MHDTGTHTAGPTRRPLMALVVEGFLLFAVLRLGLSLVGVFVATQDVPSPCHFEEALNGWQTLPELLRDGPAFPLAGVWERWDACWYIKIATFGYESGEQSAAFFPAFPMAVRVVATITFLPYPVAGMIVPAIAFVAAVTGLVRLVETSHGIVIARRAALYLGIFPSAFFLFAPFTEALFLAAVVWTLVFARERRWLLAAMLAFVAGLTRVQGLLLVLPLAWEAFVAARDARSDRRLATRDGRFIVATSVIATVAPAIAFLGFAFAARQLSGETPYDAQAFWGGTSFHPPWEVVAASYRWIVERGDGVQALNLITLIGSAALLLAAARRMPLTYSLYAWPPIILIALRIQPTPLTSTIRYVVVLFPIFIVLALLTGRPWLERAWVILSLLFLGLLTATFLSGDFVA